MAEVNFSPKLAGSLISILPRAAAKTFENRSSISGVDLKVHLGEGRETGKDLLA
jgi:hypothetical protein